MNLQGKNIILRAPEVSDLDVLYLWENDPEIWHISNTLVPFSKYILKKFIENSHLSILETKQVRFMIDLKNDNKHIPIGTIDLFDYEPLHSRIGIGILIKEEKNRQKGYASEALSLALNYCFNFLQINQVFCNILIDNEISIKLFKKFGFEITGCKKQWLKINNHYKDEYILQLIRK
jgi:diamine N-acetyltransferase